MICGSAIDSAPICSFGVPWDAVFVPGATWDLLPNNLVRRTPQWSSTPITPLYSPAPITSLYQVSSNFQVSIMRPSCAHNTEQVFIGRDNRTEWVIGQVDPITGVYAPVIDLTATTRAVWCIGDVLVDSNIDPSVIWWTDFVMDKPLPDGTLFTGNVLRARAGIVPGLQSGSYPTTRIVLYDSTHPDGIVVAFNLHTTVYDPCYQ